MVAIDPASTTTSQRTPEDLLKELDRIYGPVLRDDQPSNRSRTPVVTGVGLFPSNQSHHAHPQHPPPTARDTNLHVVLPAVGCFCFGILIASIIGIALYTKQRKRWNQGRGDSHSQSETGDNPKFALFQNDPLGDFFSHKEGTVSQDMQSALNFLATPFICNSFTDTQQPPPTARERALQDLQNEIDRETRGETQTEDWTVNEDGPPPAYPDDIVWSLPDSDVVVTIRAGALPRSNRQQNTLKVALGANPLNVTRSRDQVQLTPLLILSSPSVARFDKPLEVRVPHRAHLTASAGWRVLLRYSGTQQDNINKLEWQDAAQDMRSEDRTSEVTYSYDGDFLYVRTLVPGLFCGVGSGARKQKPLKVAAMAFAYPLPPQTCEPEPGQETGNCGIDIKVFFVDYFKEAMQHLEKLEEAAGGVCISKPLPLRMANEKDWQVILVSADNLSWPYRIHDGHRVKLMSTEALYQNFGVGQAVEFRIFSIHPPDGVIDQFQATFSLAQKRHNPSNVVATLLTTQTLLLPLIMEIGLQKHCKECQKKLTVQNKSMEMLVSRSSNSSTVSSSLSRGSIDTPFPVPVSGSAPIHRDLLHLDLADLTGTR